MDNTMMVALSRQLVLRRAMDITANNIANSSTAGFKPDRPAYTTDYERKAHHEDGPRRVAFVDDWAVGRDFSVGALEQTGRPLDVALRSEGFFAIQRGDDILFTRDGRFAIDPDGRLTTAAGNAVLDDGDAEIFIPASAPVKISQNGTVEAGGAQIARLQIAVFDDPRRLQKQGDGLFTAAEDLAFDIADEPDVRQGYVERSGVQSVLEVTRMIEISRAYQSVARLIKDQEDLQRRAVDKLAGGQG